MQREVKFITSIDSPAKNSDRKILRLIGILSKLNNNEQFTSKELSNEFGVGIRTIQKDLQELNYFFPLEKNSQGEYKFMLGTSLSKSYLTPDEMILVSLALSQFKDIDNFNELTTTTLKKLLQPKIFNPFYVNFQDLEDLEINSVIIKRLEYSIKEKYHISINFNNNEMFVEPYKIVNLDGIWYLLGKDEKDNKIKNFMINKIKNVEIIKEKHKKTQTSIENVIQKIHSAWFTEGNYFKVKIKVYPKIATYFKLKDFLQSQVIEKELEDGSLIVSFEVSHYEDIDNIIKSWIPDIEIIEPFEFRRKIINELEDYLSIIKNNENLEV